MDCSYIDNDSNNYLTESGTMGCVLVSDISNKKYKPEYGQHIIDFNKPFECLSYSPREIIVFGHVHLQEKSYYDNIETYYA